MSAWPSGRPYARLLDRVDLPAKTSYLSSMAPRRNVFSEALGLPLDERAQLAHELLLSLEEESALDPEVVERAWAKEVDRRMREIDSGTAKLHSWTSVRREVDAALRSVRRERGGSPGGRGR